MSKFSVPQILGSFICKRQSAALEQLISGEEGLYFQETLEALAALIAGMPQTGDTDGEGDDAVVYLHYFMGNFDFWITERDMGDGSADPDNAELGYISLPELFASNVELDLNWAPKTLAQVRASI